MYSYTCLYFLKPILLTFARKEIKQDEKNIHDTIALFHGAKLRLFPGKSGG